VEEYEEKWKSMGKSGRVWGKVEEYGEMWKSMGKAFFAVEAMNCCR